MGQSHWLELVATILEWIGVGVIVFGATLASARFLKDLLTAKHLGAYDRFRADLGRGILLGLEFLVGSDIVATITAPLTWESVGLLGLIVIIRTFLSFSLDIEIEGQVPWRRHEQRS